MYDSHRVYSVWSEMPCWSKLYNNVHDRGSLFSAGKYGRSYTVCMFS